MIKGESAGRPFTGNGTIAPPPAALLRREKDTTEVESPPPAHAWGSFLKRTACESTTVPWAIVSNFANLLGGATAARGAYAAPVVAPRALRREVEDFTVVSSSRETVSDPIVSAVRRRDRMWMDPPRSFTSDASSPGTAPSS